VHVAADHHAGELHAHRYDDQGGRRRQADDDQEGYYDQEGDDDQEGEHGQEDDECVPLPLLPRARIPSLTSTDAPSLSLAAKKKTTTTKKPKATKKA